VRRRRAYPLPGRGVAGAGGLPRHPRRRHGRPGLPPLPPGRGGGRLPGRPARAARRPPPPPGRRGARGGGGPRRARRRARGARRKGGRVGWGASHMWAIRGLPCRMLWEERQVMSVASLTRADAREFLDVAPKAGVKTEVVRYPLARANEALADLREGCLQGAAVLMP